MITTPDVDAEKVLRDRTTICSGYSNLYQALAEAMKSKVSDCCRLRQRSSSQR